MAEKMLFPVLLLLSFSVACISAAAPLPLGTFQCRLCTLAISRVHVAFEQPDGKDLVNNLIGKICALEKISPVECSVIQLEDATILKAIRDNLVPGSVCPAIGMCPNATVVKRPTPVEQAVADPSVNADARCEFCKFFVSLMDQAVSQNKTQAEVNATLHKVCDALPVAYKGLCNMMIPKVLAFMKKGVTPQVACIQLSLCPNTTALKFVSEIHERFMSCETCQTIIESELPNIGNTLASRSLCTEPVQFCPAGTLVQTNEVDVVDTKEKVGNLECSLCEIIVTAVDLILRNNHSAAAINETVYKLCNDLPLAEKLLCDELAPKIVKELEKGGNPKVVCTDIHVCGGSNNKVPIPLTVKKTDDVLCTLCEVVFKTVDSLVKENRSEAAINETIYRVCSALPGEYRDKCYAFAPLLVKYIENGVDPATACKDIGLCPKSNLVAQMSAMFNPHVKGVIKCDVCIEAIKILDDNIKKQEGAAKNETELICHRLPPPTDAACLGFIETSFQSLWTKIITDFLVPKKMCDLFKFCP